jgi:uncharacterized protein (TIRG00374 family)
MPKSRILSIIFNGLVLLALVWAAFKYLRPEAVGDALERIDLTFLPVLLLLALLYIALKTWRFALCVGAIADLPFWRVAQSFLASQPLTLLPGGIAGRTLFLHQAGAPLGTAIVPTVMMSVLDQTVFILALFAAAFSFEGARTPAYIALTAMLLIAACLILPFSRKLAISLAHRLGKQYKVTDHLKEFSQALEESTSPARLFTLFCLTLADFFLTVLILDISLRSVGASADYSVLFLTYILPTMVGRFTILPGGVGLTEAGMVGTLASLAHLDINLAAAGVLVFRIASVLLQSGLGALVYFISWKPLSKQS